MAANVNKTSRAEQDITDAITHLLARNRPAPERFVLDFQKLTHTLSQFPELFPIQRRSAKPEWQNVRMAVLQRFGQIVFYTYENDTVIIRRVIHGARNEP